MILLIDLPWWKFYILQFRVCMSNYENNPHSHSFFWRQIQSKQYRLVWCILWCIHFKLICVRSFPRVKTWAKKHLYTAWISSASTSMQRILLTDYEQGRFFATFITTLSTITGLKQEIWCWCLIFKIVYLILIHQLRSCTIERWFSWDCAGLGMLRSRMLIMPC